MALAIALIAGVFGLIVGSFLNVVIYRVPAGMSVVSPPSACPACGARVRAFDNIPVVSWLILRGRCRDCGARISARYPLVELGTGAALAVVASTFAPLVIETATRGEGLGLAAAILQLAAFGYLAAITVALALIDLDVHRLPNSIVLPAYVVGCLLLGLAGMLTSEWSAILRAALGAVSFFLLHLLLAFVWAGGMGMGDVKLSGVLGLFLAWLGWPQLIVGLLASFILGGIFGVVLLIIGRNRRQRIAYGPWMLLGSWVGILFGAQLSAWYLGVFGLA